MAIVTLAVFLDAQRASAARLDYALRIGARQQAALIVVWVEVPHATIAGDRGAETYARGNGIDDVTTRLNLENRAARQRIADQLDRAYRETGMRSEIRDLPLESTTAAAVAYARYTDLVILAAPHVGDGQREPYGWSTEAVLREAHTPTIVVPTSAKGNSGCDRIMIAWNASSESHRAVADAMPLLEAASVVRVLTIEAKVGVHGHGDEPGADIARHLAKHNVQVDVDRVEHVSGSLADTILHRSYDFTADLLVAGAFGHSRASHIVFGSTTSDLLALSPIPIFFSR